MTAIRAHIAARCHMSYMPGQPMARDTRCPLCRGHDSQGHIFGSCMHPDMSKQYIARHYKAMRTVIQAFTKGQCGSHYLFADVGKIEGLQDIGVHSKGVPAFVLPDRCLQARGLDPTVERGFLQGGAADTRSKMRPDMMIVEMTTAEQQQYLHHDDNSGSRLTPLTPMMPNGNPRSIKIVEDIVLIQDMRKSCKKREHSIKHWRKLSRTMVTMLALCLLL